MCRSKLAGGRRCPAVRGSGEEPAEEVGPDSPAAQVRFERELSAAQEAVASSPLSPVPGLLTGALERRVHHGESGGDPRVFDAQVAEARSLVVGVLTGRGASVAEATAAATRLEEAYLAWRSFKGRSGR